MTPSDQQKALAQCLELQPLVGWPQWRTWKNWQRLVFEPKRGGWHIQRRCRTDEPRWIAGRRIQNHEALCIWQDHLLRWLAAYADEHKCLFEIGYDRGKWDTALYTSREPVSKCYPHLIFALINAVKQIQGKETAQ